MDLICIVAPKHEKKGVEIYVKIQQEKWFHFLGAGQNLVYTLLSLMPSTYQHENLEAMFGMFVRSTRLSSTSAQ
ncbi:hypothetical protein CAL7716_004410 [Calothrix sp. PCC 7716]|nr:hypothetical protein CAL7716_004410 [Calothrix sp. PCC 7716]